MYRLSFYVPGDWAERVMADVIEALIAAHPYEEPAYGFWRIGRLEDLREGGWTLNGTWMESE